MNLRAHLTYANVTATLALFVALGGSAYAAATITGRDVRNNSLTGRDVRSLTSKDVKDGSLRAVDFRPGDLNSPSQFVVRTAAGFSHGDCFENCEGEYLISDSVHCYDHERAVGGGVSPTPTSLDEAHSSGDDFVIESRPLVRGFPMSAVGWRGTVRYTINQSPAAIPMEPGVYVICASD